MNSNSTTRRAPSPPPRVPHVFVIPPEEEQQETPPWCCFDADVPPDDSGDCPHGADIPLVNVPCPTQPEQPLGTPIFRVGSINETSVKVATPKKLAKKQRPDAVRIVERRENRRDVREDSDVIEVVKVKRGKDALTDPEEYTKMKRSKTFKARATKALQSIKNVGRSSRKQHIKDLWTSSESVPGVFKGLQEQIRQQQEQLHPEPAPSPAKGRPSLSRSNSRSLSQMFQSAMSFRPPSPFHPHLPASSEIPPSPAPSTSPARVKTSSPMPTICEALTPQPISDRPDSPSPSVKSNKRFSVRELHKIFAFSSPLPDDSLPPSPTSPPPPPQNVSVPSTSASSDYPDVPTEGAHATIHFLDLDNVDRKLTGFPHHPAVVDDDDDYGTLLSQRQRDLSFEMRLDSLHFDSLSFDPERFNMSMDRSRIRF